MKISIGLLLACALLAELFKLIHVLAATNMLPLGFFAVAMILALLTIIGESDRKS